MKMKQKVIRKLNTVLCTLVSRKTEIKYLYAQYITILRFILNVVIQLCCNRSIIMQIKEFRTFLFLDSDYICMFFYMYI